MTAMVQAVVGVDVLAPAFGTGWLIVVTVLVGAAYAAFEWVERRTAPPRPPAAASVTALRPELPAVVNMLTNDATVTAGAFRATMIDLAARGWLRILPPDDDNDLARVRPAAQATDGDALRPHERLVLQHVIARFTTDRAIPAQYLAVDIRGGWWRRFARLVADEALVDGVVTRRWRLSDAAVPGGLAVLAAWAWWLGARAGTDVAVIDSVERRIVSWVLIAAVVVLAVRVVSVIVRPTFTLTNEGVVATRSWLAVRQALNQGGFGDLAPSALQLGDRRLAFAAAMCLADGATVELPLAREDHFRAWSSAGGRARLVRISYPARLGYGMAPIPAVVTGVVLWFVGTRLRRWSDEVARGEAFPWIYERLPEQDWLIEHVATAITIISFVPILAGIWLAITGVADAFTTVERTGIVLRARRPVEVSPLPRRLRRHLDRDRYRVFVAVDDGSKDDLVAWRATERAAVPQGARAMMRSSRVLGRVRNATPVGHRLVD